MKTFLRSLAVFLAWALAGAWGVYLLALNVADLAAEPTYWAALRAFVLGVALFMFARLPFMPEDAEEKAEESEG